MLTQHHFFPLPPHYVTWNSLVPHQIEAARNNEVGMNIWGHFIFRHAHTQIRTHTYIAHIYIYFHTCEKWSISGHVSKQGCHSHQWFQPSRANRKENNTCNLVLQTIPSGCSHSLWWTLREKKGYWLQMAEKHMKKRISVSPESCIFLYTEKC